MKGQYSDSEKHNSPSLNVGNLYLTLPMYRVKYVRLDKRLTVFTEILNKKVQCCIDVYDE